MLLTLLHAFGEGDGFALSVAADVVVGQGSQEGVEDACAVAGKLDPRHLLLTWGVGSVAGWVVGLVVDTAAEVQKEMVAASSEAWVCKRGGGWPVSILGLWIVLRQIKFT